jgi:hypothetical protein
MRSSKSKEGQTMGSRFFLGLLAGLVLLSSALIPGAASAEKADASMGACSALWITTPDPPGKSRAPRPAPTFSAAKVLDLELRVTVPAAYAGAKVEVKLFTPKGQLYQTLEVKEGASAGEEQQARKRPRPQTLTARFPVAGTTIVNSSLYGTWKAAAYFEGAGSPCTKARKFTIKP